MAFAAATLLPIGSEWLLAIQLARVDTLAHQVSLLVIATLANTAGGALTYVLGRAGAELARADLRRHHPRADRLGL